MKITFISLFFTLYFFCSNGQNTFQHLYSAALQTQFIDAAPTSDSGYIVCGLVGSISTDYLITKINENGDVEWAKHVGSWVGNEIAYKVGEVAGSGYYILGTTNSFSFNAQINLIRFDESGNIIWNKIYSGGEYTSTPSIRTTTSGGFIISATLTDNTGNYFFLIKIDASGNTIWSNGYGTNYLKYTCRDVDVCTDGGCIAVGDDFVSGIVIYKTDVNGNLNWSKKYSSGYTYTAALSVAAISDLGYIISGVLDDGGVYYLMLMEIDVGGNFLWGRKYNLPNNYYAFGSYSVHETPDGGFIMNSLFNNLNNVFPGITKVNSIGKFEWSKYYTVSNIFYSFPLSVKLTGDGGYVVSTGGYDLTSNVVGNLIKTDSLGETNCSVLQDSLADSPITMYVTTLSTSFPIGESNSISFTSDDIPILVSSNCSTNVAVSELHTEESGIAIFPNPTADYFMVSNLDARTSDITITDVVGKKIFVAAVNKQNEISIDASAWTDGMYYVNVNAEGEVIQSKKILCIK